MPETIKTPVGDAPVIPVVLIIAGGYLAWFGVHYWRRDVQWPTEPIKKVLQGQSVPEPGQPPPTAATLLSNIEQQAGPVGQAGPVATNSAIANAAQRYIGQDYKYGGKADRPGNWDCSSFVSYVLSHDLGLPLPHGGHYGDPGYPPHTHGPATREYLFYGSPITRSQVRAGDLVVWQTHMGIAISNSEMVSARSASSVPPTGIDRIDGDIPGEKPFYRRVRVSAGEKP